MALSWGVSGLWPFCALQRCAADAALHSTSRRCKCETGLFTAFQHLYEHNRLTTSHTSTLHIDVIIRALWQSLNFEREAK